MQDDKPRRIARALGISIRELDQLTWHCNSYIDGKGNVYARRIEFTEPVPPEIATKIRGLEVKEPPLDRGVVASALYD